MPQIKEYTAENDKLRPSDLGVEAYGQAARRVGAFYQQAGEVIKQSSADVARAAEAQARAAQSRATAAGALATEEKAKAGAYSGVVGTAGTAIEQAEAFAGHQEVSAGAKNFVQARESLTNEWNGKFDQQAKADPNNTTINQGFMQGRFEQWAQSYTKGFITPQGRDWAEQQVNHLRDHFAEKTTADMSSMAGIAAKSNLDKMATSWTNIADKDPSSVEDLVGKMKDGKRQPGEIDRLTDGVVSSNPHLKGTQAVKIHTDFTDQAKRSVIEAGAMSVAKNAGDPEAAVRDYVRRFPELISSQDADKIVKGAVYFKRLNDSETRTQQAQAEHNQKIDFNTKMDQLQAATTPQNPGDKPQLPANYWDQVRQLSTHPGAALEPGRLESMVQQGNAITAKLAEKAETPSAVSKQNTQEWLDRIMDGGDRNYLRTEIMKHYKDFTTGDMNFLLNEVERGHDQRTVDAKKQLLESVRPMLDKTPDGMYRFWYKMNENLDDPKIGKTIFDPSSPNYMGGINSARQFMMPLQQQTKDNGGVGAPAATNIQKGEVRTFQGKRYEFQGGQNVKSNWKELPQ